MTSGRGIIYSTLNSQAWFNAIYQYQQGVANAENEIKNMQAGRIGYDDKSGAFGKDFENPFGVNLATEEAKRIKVSIIGSKAEFLLRELAREIHQADKTIDQSVLAKHLIYKATDQAKGTIIEFIPPRIQLLFDKIRNGRIRSDPQKAELKALKDEFIKKEEPFHKELLKFLDGFVTSVRLRIDETEFKKEFDALKMSPPGFGAFTQAISTFYPDPTVQKAYRLMRHPIIFPRIYPAVLGEIEKIDRQDSLGPHFKCFLDLWGRMLNLSKVPYNRCVELDKDFEEKAQDLDKNAGLAPRYLAHKPQIGDDLCRAFEPFLIKSPQAAAPAQVLLPVAPAAQTPVAPLAAAPVVQTPVQVVPAAPAPAPAQVAAPAVRAPVQMPVPALIQSPAKIQLVAVPVAPAAKEPVKKKGFLAFIARPFVWFEALVKSFFAWLFGKS